MIGNPAHSGLRADWRTQVAVGLWSLLGFTAVLLTGRALVGAFDAQVSAVVPAVTTSIAMLCSFGAAWLYRWANERLPSESLSPVGDLSTGLSSLAAPALIGWSTTVNAAPFAAGIVTGILVLGLTAVIVCEGVRMTPAAARSSAPSSGSVASSAVRPLRQRGSSVPEAELIQQFVRKQTPDGCERIEAVLLARFASGERETAVHLPIHPNLKGTPRVECEPLDESPVSITVTAAQPYGIRVELKRAAATDSLTVPIGVEISASEPAISVA